METAFCIYSKKDETNASFKAREHIIPKCIGGIECLPLGWVSDEVNNEFSALELEFARNNPLIDIPRSYGDTNLGRKKHSKRKRMQLVKMNKNFTIGYVDDGKDYYLDTINIIYKNDTEIRIFSNVKHETSELNKENTDLLMNEIKCIDFKDIIKINSNKLIDQCILGKHDGWYLFYPSNFSDEILQKIFDYIRNNNFSSSSAKTERSMESTFNNEYKYNTEKVKRVYAKIVFNALAKIKGRDFVLDERFDKIRTAIVNGDNIINLVELISINPLKNLCCQYDGLKSIIDNKNVHSIFYLVKDKNLYGFISCFGSNCHKILLAENIVNEDMPFEGFICDYKNKKEDLLSSFIGKYSENKIVKYLEDR